MKNLTRKKVFPQKTLMKIKYEISKNYLFVKKKNRIVNDNKHFKKNHIINICNKSYYMICSLHFNPRKLYSLFINKVNLGVVYSFYIL